MSSISNVNQYTKFPKLSHEISFIQYGGKKNLMVITCICKYMKTYLYLCSKNTDRNKKQIQNQNTKKQQQKKKNKKKHEIF